MVERFGVLYESNVLLTVGTEHAPFISASERAQVTPLEESFVRVVLRYGYMEEPNVPADLLVALRAAGIEVGIAEVTFVLGRETIVPSPHGRLSGLRERLFAFLARNSRNATDYFGLPSAQVVEVGSQIDL